MHWLNKIAKHHQEWIKIAVNFGARDYAEDIVQEAYIRVHKYSNPEKIIKNDKVNKGYMFFIIRNICNNFNNELKKTRKLPLNDHVYNISNESLESEKDIALQNIINKMDKELENWHFYEKGIFKIYRDSGLSIRGIAKETKISSVNIFHTLKKSKNKMREMFGEDFEDYINGDFDLID